MKQPFKVIEGTDPERMQISFENRADIYLIKTEEGLIIDVYDKREVIIHSATIWDDDLSPDESEPTDEEIEKFKEDWGQTDDEIKVNLELDEDCDDILLMDDYFWIPNDEIWCNKHTSMFTDREQRIADFLIEVLSRLD